MFFLWNNLIDAVIDMKAQAHHNFCNGKWFIMFQRRLPIDQFLTDTNTSSLLLCVSLRQHNSMLLGPFFVGHGITVPE